MAEPTFVQSKSINADDDELGLTFNNDGTKMYTTLYDNTGAGQQQDAVYEYVLTTAYDISTATLNNTLVKDNILTIRTWVRSLVSKIYRPEMLL